MHPAAHSVVTAFAAELVSAEPREHYEAVLLCLVQALVEWDGRVSEVWELHDDPASNAWLWA